MMKYEAESVTEMTVDLDEDDELTRLEGPYVCFDMKEDLSLDTWLHRIHDDKLVDTGKLLKGRDVHDLLVDKFPIPSPRLGKALAAAHGQNRYLKLLLRRWSPEQIRDFFTKEDLGNLLKVDRDLDRAEQQAMEYGPDLCSSIMANMKASLTDVLKNDVPDCDGCCVSSMGRDVGMPLMYSISYTLAYAVQGDPTLSMDSLESMNRFWEAYDQLLRRDCVLDEESLCKTFRYGLGWCAWSLYAAVYRSKAYNDVLPLFAVGDEDEGIVLETIGLIGLKLMHLCFGREDCEDLSLEELKEEVDDELQLEMDTLLAVYMVNRDHRRRSSRTRREFPSKSLGQRSRRRSSQHQLYSKSGSSVEREGSFSLSTTIGTADSEDRWQDSSQTGLNFAPRRRLPSVVEHPGLRRGGDSSRWTANESFSDLESLNQASAPQRRPSYVMSRSSTVSEMSDRWTDCGTSQSLDCSISGCSAPRRRSTRIDCGNLAFDSNNSAFSALRRRSTRIDCGIQSNDSACSAPRRRPSTDTLDSLSPCPPRRLPSIIMNRDLFSDMADMSDSDRDSWHESPSPSKDSRPHVSPSSLHIAVQFFDLETRDSFETDNIVD